MFLIFPILPFGIKFLILSFFWVDNFLQSGELKKPIIISTGLATLKDIDLVVKTIKKRHNRFAILKYVSSYPNPIEDLNLHSIKIIKDRYNCPVGFSDHTLGDLAAKVAITQGATIIEKHFKLDEDNS